MAYISQKEGVGLALNTWGKIAELAPFCYNKEENFLKEECFINILKIGKYANRRKFHRKRMENYHE